MDPDAPPLVKADALASQGEQLSSRRAYQQAHGAHTEAAKQYQLAAQATGDTAAAKALLLQRDKQLKLANEVQRKLERGRSKPANISATATPSSTTTTTTGSHAAAQISNTAQSFRPYGGVNFQPPSSGSNSGTHGLAYRRSYNGPSGGHGPSITTMTGLQQQYSPAGRMNIGATGAFSTLPTPRDRIDASTANMADSRYSRKSNSPSQSQISHSLPHSGAESVKTSSVEESYYLMNTENDPADPVTTFLTVVENMVEELGNAVAFASAPLHVGPPVSGHSDSDPSVHGQKASDNVLQRTSKAERKRDIASNQVLESFYVVPSINRPGKPARGNSAPILEEGLSRPNSASNKTHEELVAENTTLKETLDQLSKRLDWITKERLKEKETLKDSVTIFARDVRKQAERLGQSTISFTDNRRQIIPPLPQPMTALPVFMHGINNNSHQTEELQKKVLYLQEEVKLAKLESEKQAANAQRYKARYDDLRKAILEKRKAKEMALAAATAAAGTGVVADNTSTPDRARTGETAVRHSSDHQSRTAATTEGRQDGKASPTT